jgi:two-component sensor histidine kinase
MLFTASDERRPVRLIGTVRDVTDEREADRRVAEALAAKEVLLKEVNHRVKNSLQLVSGILALQSRGLPELSRKEFEEARLRIQAVALVHERLHKAADVRRVDLRAFLDALCRDLKQATVGDRAVDIALDVPPVMVPNEQAVPLALIVNELVTNALKYAYPDGTGAIRVAVARGADDLLCLTVGDDGVGLPESFEEKAKTSLGMRLVRALAHQIGGSVAHERREPGTAFHVTFRLSDAPEPG